MDAFLKKIDRLAALARAETAPVPLDRESLLRRIRGLSREDDAVLSMSFGFFAGGAAAAAAAALAVTFLAVSAWSEMNSPLAAIDTLFNVMDVL